MPNRFDDVKEAVLEVVREKLDELEAEFNGLSNEVAGNVQITIAHVYDGGFNEERWNIKASGQIAIEMDSNTDNAEPKFSNDISEEAHPGTWSSTDLFEALDNALKDLEPVLDQWSKQD